MGSDVHLTLADCKGSGLLDLSESSGFALPRLGKHRNSIFTLYNCYLVYIRVSYH